MIFNKEGKIKDINTTHNHNSDTKKVKINITKNTIKKILTLIIHFQIYQKKFIIMLYHRTIQNLTI